MGINATEIAFSAKRRRKRFGIINAVENASACMLVPKKEAFVISRSNPMIREAKVMSESTSPDLTMDFFCFSVFFSKISVCVIFFILFP